MQVTDKMLAAAVRKAAEVMLMLPGGCLDVTERQCRQVKAVVEAALAEADDPAGTIERLTHERDAIARLCYRKVETEDLDRETYYRLVILGLFLQRETYDTEPEVIAAVRRLAGLDAAPIPDAEDRP